MGAILVTGGAGFIGSHVVGRLLARGDSVLVLDSFDNYYDPAIKRRNLRAAIGDAATSRFALVEADIRDTTAIGEVFAGNDIDAVVHLAARAGVRPSIEAPLLYDEVNVKGTNNLLEACRRHGVRRFIFGSSSSVYGDSTDVPFREDARVDRPVSPYAATKVAGELLCYTYHHLFGIDVSCLRFFTVYGPRQRPEMAIHKFARLILQGQPLQRFGDGRTERDYTYIDDILDGILKALDQVSGYDVFNLGESRRVSLSRLIEIIESEIGVRAKVESMPEQPGDVKMTCADITHAREKLGYAPTVPIEEGIRRFVTWLKAEVAFT
ncbi:MAG TPA: NAD-dependent epimerase/dehydratase family protein [Patescibacteria group bacterium]|jgi:UDP-glucuronate 4-epimerase|nr:NAD-dependent epimerase/dehydratase family protein [Patescibacteria group bacterium]